MNPNTLNGVKQYLTATSCKAAGGKWTRFITNYVEKSEGVLDSCLDKSVNLVRGLTVRGALKITGSGLEKTVCCFARPR